MTVMVTVSAQVTATAAAAAPETVAARDFVDLSVMELGRVRGWVKREFNKALARQPHGVIVRGGYRGQLTAPPYTTYDGHLSGHNGRMTQDWE